MWRFFSTTCSKLISWPVFCYPNVWLSLADLLIHQKGCTWTFFHDKRFDSKNKGFDGKSLIMTQLHIAPNHGTIHLLKRKCVLLWGHFWYCASQKENWWNRCIWSLGYPGSSNVSYQTVLAHYWKCHFRLPITNQSL